MSEGRLIHVISGDIDAYYLNGVCLGEFHRDASQVIPVIKAIREHVSLDLKSAKELWDFRVTTTETPRTHKIRSAAMDMFEALEAFESWWEHQPPSMTQMTSVASGIREALRKARGEQS